MNVNRYVKSDLREVEKDARADGDFEHADYLRDAADAVEEHNRQKLRAVNGRWVRELNGIFQ